MGFRSALFASRYDAATRFAERTELGRRRAALLAGLSGEVVDVGAGTGANLPHFPPSCTVTAVEPDPHMRRRLEAKVGAAVAPVKIADGSAEALPAADGTVDAVVFTLVLCTVPDQVAALAETRRVLKPGGRMLFLEHVRGTGPHAKIQDFVQPFWSFAAQGCHPNRDTLAALKAAGFTVSLDDQFTIGPDWLPTNPLLMGTATAE